MRVEQIFAPFLTMLVLTLIVWVYMYYRRLTYIFANKIDPQSLTTRDRAAGQYPPTITYPSDNLKNLFELPVLFYALCLYLFATQSVDAIHVWSAWVFVAFRVLHSLIHCSLNVVKYRFASYAVSAVALWFMVSRAVVDAV